MLMTMNFQLVGNITIEVVELNSCGAFQRSPPQITPSDSNTDVTYFHGSHIYYLQELSK